MENIREMASHTESEMHLIKNRLERRTERAHHERTQLLSEIIFLKAKLAGLSGQELDDYTFFNRETVINVDNSNLKEEAEREVKKAKLEARHEVKVLKFHLDEQTKEARLKINGLQTALALRTQELEDTQEELTHQLQQMEEEYTEKVAVLNTTVKQRDDEMDAMTKEHLILTASYKEEILGLRAALKDKEEELNNECAERRLLRKDLHEIQQRLFLYKSDNKHLIADLENELTRRHTEEMLQLEADRSISEKDREAMSRRMNKALSKLQHNEEQIDILEQQLEMERSKILHLESVCEDLEVERESLDRQLTEYRDTLKDKFSDEAITNTFKELRLDIQHKEKVIFKYQGKIGDLEKEIRQLNARLRRTYLRRRSSVASKHFNSQELIQETQAVEIKVAELGESLEVKTVGFGDTTGAYGMARLNRLLHKAGGPVTAGRGGRGGSSSEDTPQPATTVAAPNSGYAHRKSSKGSQGYSYRTNKRGMKQYQGIRIPKALNVGTMKSDDTVAHHASQNLEDRFPETPSTVRFGDLPTPSTPKLEITFPDDDDDGGNNVATPATSSKAANSPFGDDDNNYTSTEEEEEEGISLDNVERPVSPERDPYSASNLAVKALLNPNNSVHVTQIRVRKVVTELGNVASKFSAIQDQSASYLKELGEVNWNIAKWGIKKQLWSKKCKQQLHKPKKMTIGSALSVKRHREKVLDRLVLKAKSNKRIITQAAATSLCASLNLANRLMTDFVRSLLAERTSDVTNQLYPATAAATRFVQAITQSKSSNKSADVFRQVAMRVMSPSFGRDNMKVRQDNDTLHTVGLTSAKVPKQQQAAMDGVSLAFGQQLLPDPLNITNGATHSDTTTSNLNSNNGTSNDPSFSLQEMQRMMQIQLMFVNTLKNTESNTQNSASPEKHSHNSRTPGSNNNNGKFNIINCSNMLLSNLGGITSDALFSGLHITHPPLHRSSPTTTRPPQTGLTGESLQSKKSDPLDSQTDIIRRDSTDKNQQLPTRTEFEEKLRQQMARFTTLSVHDGNIKRLLDSITILPEDAQFSSCPVEGTQQTAVSPSLKDAQLDKSLQEAGEAVLDTLKATSEDTAHNKSANNTASLGGGGSKQQKAPVVRPKSGKQEKGTSPHVPHIPAWKRELARFHEQDVQKRKLGQEALQAFNEMNETSRVHVIVDKKGDAIDEEHQHRHQHDNTVEVSARTLPRVVSYQPSPPSSHKKNRLQRKQVSAEGPLIIPLPEVARMLAGQDSAYVEAPLAQYPTF